MFTLLRGVLIIGVLFYFSPERQARTGSPDGGMAGEEPGKRPPVLLDGKAAEATWKKMAVAVTEEAVRAAVQDKAEAAGLRLRDHAPWAALDGAHKAASARDGARPQDGDPKSIAGQAIRCVYRCDGTE
jgi:hypothetical protein